MSNQNTPGSWIIKNIGYDTLYKCNTFIESDTGSTICAIYRSDSPDARLIVESPTMYSAIVMMLDALRLGRQEYIDKSREAMDFIIARIDGVKKIEK